MTTIAPERPTAPPPEPSSFRAPPHRHGHRRTVPLALAVAGAGTALVVGLDGTWYWCIVRVLVVGAVVARAMAVAGRASPTRVGIWTAVLGFVTLPAGLTIGYSYATTVGWSVRTVGGLLAAGGSLVLATVGVTALVRSVTRWRRWLAVPAVLVVLYAVAAPIAMAVYATNVPRPEVGSITPADRGFAFEDVAFATADGVTLSGWYIPSTDGAAVTVMHGSSSTRSSVLDEAMVLAHHGYGVLLFDARGHGRSGGRAMDFGWFGDKDIGAAVTYLTARPDVDPNRIAAVGMSMGGEEAIGAMATDSRLRAVVAEGATNRVAGDWSWLSGAYGVRGWLQRGVHAFTYGVADVLTEASPPITLRAAVAAAAPRPVLLIAAGNVADETKADNDVRQASPESVEVWTVPGANHVGGLGAQPQEWEQRVTSFLDAALLR